MRGYNFSSEDNSNENGTWSKKNVTPHGLVHALKVRVQLYNA